MSLDPATRLALAEMETTPATRAGWLLDRWGVRGIGERLEICQRARATCAQACTLSPATACNGDCLHWDLHMDRARAEWLEDRDKQQSDREVASFLRTMRPALWIVACLAVGSVLAVLADWLWGGPWPQ